MARDDEETSPIWSWSRRDRQL